MDDFTVSFIEEMNLAAIERKLEQRTRSHGQQ